MKRKKTLELLSICFFFLFFFWACEEKEDYTDSIDSIDKPDVMQPESTEHEIGEEGDIFETADDIIFEEISEENEEEVMSVMPLYVIKETEIPALLAIEPQRLVFQMNSEIENLLNEVDVGTIILSGNNAWQWDEAHQEYRGVEPRQVWMKSIRDGQLELLTEPASWLALLEAAGIDHLKVELKKLELVPPDSGRGGSPDEVDLILISNGEIPIYDDWYGPVHLVARLRDVNALFKNSRFFLEIQAEGLNLTFFDLNFTTDFEWGYTTEIQADMGLRGAIETSVPGSPTVSQTFYGSVEGLPVIVKVEASLVAGVEIETEGSISLSKTISSTDPISLSIRYNPTDRWSVNRSLNLFRNLEATEPTLRFQTEAGIKVYLRPELSLKFYWVAGPEIGLGPFLQARLQPNTTPCIDITAGIDGTFSLLTLEVLWIETDVISLPIFDPPPSITIVSRNSCGEGYDEDRDGFTEAEGDCDNTDPLVYPDAEEIPDGKDNDCDGEIDEGICTCTDNDGDGYYATSCSDPDCPQRTDCDNSRSDVYPGAPELEDRVDNNCNGEIDELCTCYDSDGDGFYPLDCYDASCPNRTDCDDSRASIHPGAPEVCNGLDDDCDSVVDEDGVCIPDEVCNGIDDDGDTHCDEGFECCRGTTETQSCGSCGTRSRICGASCSWGAWSACSESGICSPGATQNCGNCGTQTCTSSCTWGPCTGEGVCSPGATETRSCACGGNESRTCFSDCSWSGWSGCSTTCSPGSSRSCTTSCGSTGTQTCSSDGCSWGICVPPAESCNGLDDDCDGDVDEGCVSCPPQVTIISAGPWEEGSACEWYDLVLDIDLNGARKYECIELNWHGDDTSIYSFACYTIYSSGVRTFDPGSCCFPSSGDLNAVFACGCSGSYLYNHKIELMEGTYDRDEVTFYHRTPTYDCP